MQKNIILKENQNIILPLLIFNEQLSRSYNISLTGTGAYASVLVIILGKCTNKINLDIKINHLKPNTKSEIIIKGIIKDSSYLSFNGLVKIPSGSINSQTWLSAQTLLLSSKAKSKIIPSLEISENNVKAGHEATTGQINNLELFYLMSRGLSEKKSKALIINGFISKILNKFPQEIQDKINHELHSFTLNEL